MTSYHLSSFFSFFPSLRKPIIYNCGFLFLGEHFCFFFFFMLSSTNYTLVVLHSNYTLVVLHSFYTLFFSLSFKQWTHVEHMSFRVGIIISNRKNIRIKKRQKWENKSPLFYYDVPVLAA